MKIFAIVALSLLGLVILCMALYLIIGSMCFKIALSRKSTVKRVVNKTMQKLIKQYKIDFSWWDKFDFQTLTTTSQDGLKLVAHFLPSTTNKLAIIVHGYGADYREMHLYTKYFVENHYNILALENRAHGNSEGKMMGMGWLDRLDIINWINIMLEKNSNYQIVLMGLSMGASAVCMTSGEKLPSAVKAIVSDCAFANAYDEFKYVFNHRTHLPAFPLLNIFNSYTKNIYKFDMKKADATMQVKKTKTPILFIHGDADSFVPVENVNKLYAAAPEGLKQIYIAKGAEHAMSYPSDEKEYEKQLNNFLKKYIKN